MSIPMISRRTPAQIADEVSCMAESQRATAVRRAAAGAVSAERLFSMASQDVAESKHGRRRTTKETLCADAWLCRAAANSTNPSASAAFEAEFYRRWWAAEVAYSDATDGGHTPTLAAQAERDRERNRIKTMPGAQAVRLCRWMR